VRPDLVIEHLRSLGVFLTPEKEARLIEILLADPERTENDLNRRATIADRVYGGARRGRKPKAKP
jgi:hypothetical protein